MTRILFCSSMWKRVILCKCEWFLVLQCIHFIQSFPPHPHRLSLLRQSGQTILKPKHITDVAQRIPAEIRFQKETFFIYLIQFYLSSWSDLRHKIYIVLWKSFWIYLPITLFWNMHDVKEYPCNGDNVIKGIRSRFSVYHFLTNTIFVFLILLENVKEENSWYQRTWVFDQKFVNWINWVQTFQPWLLTVLTYIK